MTFGTGLFGEGLYGRAPAEDSGPVELFVPLQIAVVAGAVVAIRVPLEIRVWSEVALSVPLTIDVRRPAVAIVVPLEIRVLAPVAIVVPLAIVVSAPVVAPVVGEAAIIWRARVVMGGVDVTDRLTGRISVEAEENAARVAHFGIVPAGVDVELSSVARQAVTISFERYDAAGVRTGLWRLFTGLVDGPEYDSASGVLTLTCSDARQAKIAAMTRAQIDALVPGGLWSPHIFDRESTSEQYLADRLGTTAGVVDGDAYGALAFTPWSGSATRTVTEAEILDESLVPVLAGAASARRSRLTVTYRRPQAVVRGIMFQYQSPPLVDQFYLGLRALTRSAVEGALSGCGATVVSPISWMDYPARAQIERVGAIVTTDAQALCLGASCWLNRRYSRWIDETWLVSIGQEGVATDEARGVSVEWDPSDSDHRRLPANAVTAFAVAKRDGPVPYIAPMFGMGERHVDYVPADQPDGAAFAVAFKAAVLTSARQVAESLRGSVIRFAVVLDPEMTLRRFLDVDTSAVVGGGKVVRVEHVLDIDDGTAITEVEVECVSVSLPPVPSPVRPSVPAKIKAGSLVAKAQTWIGGLLSSPPWNDATMFGYSTNVAAPAVGANLYPDQMSLEVPGIEEAAQGAVAAPPLCSMQAGSGVITALTSMDGFAQGVAITGAGIPAGTVIDAVNASARTVTLSNAATSTGVEREVRVETRQYITRARVSYHPTIVRNGPTVGA